MDVLTCRELLNIDTEIENYYEENISEESWKPYKEILDKLSLLMSESSHRMESEYFLFLLKQMKHDKEIKPIFTRQFNTKIMKIVEKLCNTSCLTKESITTILMILSGTRKITSSYSFLNSLFPVGIVRISNIVHELKKISALIPCSKILQFTQQVCRTVFIFLELMKDIKIEGSVDEVGTQQYKICQAVYHILTNKKICAIPVTAKKLTNSLSLSKRATKRTRLYPIT